MNHIEGSKYRCWSFRRATEEDSPSTIGYECIECHKIFHCTKPLVEMRVGWDYTAQRFGGLYVDGKPLAYRA